MNKLITRRNSKQKDVVLASVVKLNNHPTADEVFLEARKVIPTISLSTVYRNLSILTESEELLSITNLSSETRYDHNLSDHFHIYCSECGAIGDITISKSNIKALIPKKCDGFHIDGYSITFSGVCKNCIILKSSKGELDEY